MAFDGIADRTKCAESCGCALDIVAADLSIKSMLSSKRDWQIDCLSRQGPGPNESWCGVKIEFGLAYFCCRTDHARLWSLHTGGQIFERWRRRLRFLHLKSIERV